ncbi:MAG: VOC family protein, partial [Phenylobacterium sp.]
MRLRQIALVGQDLEAARAEIVDVLGLGAAYADPGVGKYGLHNAVWPVGDTFLEVVSPTREGTTAGRLLEKRQGDGGYMVILQTDDLAGARARVAEKGVR